MEEMSDCEYSFLEALGRDKVKYSGRTQKFRAKTAVSDRVRTPLFVQNVVKSIFLGNHL